MSSANGHKMNGASSAKKQFADVACQTEIQPMNYIPPKVLRAFSLESESTLSFFYKPHMVFLLSCLCAAIGYAVYEYSLPAGAADSFTKNSRLGLLIAFAMVIYYGALYFPSSLMQRPHYSFWRIILAIAVCYCGVIIFLLFQNQKDIQAVLTFFDPKLGKPLPEKSYGDKCDLYTPENKTSRYANLWDTMDVFIAAHFFGWYFKMLVVRDWKFCTFLSIFFEFLELTFKHWLPNFNECWWDSLILDVLLCNALGIYFGYLHIKYFQLKEYKWTKNRKINDKSIAGNFVSFLRSSPLMKRDWHVFSNSKRFLSVIYYIALMNAVDLSNFFNKFVLWIPASHYTLTIRIFLWGFLSIACTREYFEYIENDMFFRLGPFLFIGHIIIFVEYAMLFKFSYGQNLFTDPFPTWIVVSWTVIITGLIAIFGVLFYRDVKNKFSTWRKPSAVKQE